MANVSNQTDYRGTAAADSISGTSGNDTLYGAAGNDTIDGLGGNDSIRGDGDNDLLNGGDGDDSISGGGGADAIDGGAGFDRADFFGLSKGVTITLGGSVLGTAVEADTGVTDSLINIEEVKGTAQADTITGSDDATLEAYEGSGGNDRIDGRDGTDRVQFYSAAAGVYVNLTTGESKSLSVHLNDGSTDAGVGVDSFTNIERINGSNHGDFLTAVGFGVTANAGNMSTSRNTSNVIFGNLGNDTIVGNGDTEIAFNTNAATSGVVVDLQLGTATSDYSGNDVISGGIIGVTGTKHADRIKGANTNRSGESYTGLAGDDTFEGGGGYDVAFYGSSQTSVQIDLAAGTVIGDANIGTDTLIGIEAITGGAAADTYDASGFGLLASNPNRVDDGGFFNSFEGRGGNDTIIGNGATRIAYSNASAGVGISLIDGLGLDLVDGLALINGADPTTYTFGNLAGVGIDEFSGVNNVRGSAYGDLFIGGNRASDQLEQYEGRGGDDSIYGGTGYDRVNYHLDGIGTTFIVDNGIVQFALDENGTQVYTTGLTINMADGIVVGDPLVTGTDELRGIEGVRGTWLDDIYDARGFSANSLNAGSRGFFNDFEGFTGNDTIIGNGSTRLSYMGTFGAVYVNLETGEALDKADKLNGTSLDVAKVGVDALVGGINSLRGTSYDDILIGGVAANDLLEVFDGRTGDDVLSGGSGFDRVRYDNDGSVNAWLYNGTTLTMFDDGVTNSVFKFTQGVTVDLAAGTATGDVNFTGNDTLLGIESVYGTILADTYDATGFSATSDNEGAYGTFNEFQGKAGNDTVIGNGNTRVSYIDAFAGVLVDLDSGTSESLFSGDAAFVGVDTISGVNAVRGSLFGDEIIGSAGADVLEGMAGDDSILGGAGNDKIDGGAGDDTIFYAGDRSSILNIARTADGLSLLVKTANEGTDKLSNIEFFQFGSDPVVSVADALASFTLAPVFSSLRVDNNAAKSDGIEASEDSSVDGEVAVAQSVDTNTSLLMPDVYTGPVAGIDYQLIDTSADAVIVGGATNDFIVLQGTGNKAVDAGGGKNVIDGGTGSTFITAGGANFSDTFFLDGRAPGTSWSTIVDFELGLDKATIWGWKAGVSKVNAAFTDFNTGGAEGYTGLTLHFDNLLPDGSSSTATNPNLNSITFTGLELQDFGVSSLAELNTQLTNQSNSHFQVSSVTDAFGEHGYLYIS
jgi:Ca2+-binding RTX toxin-like protein